MRSLDVLAVLVLAVLSAVVAAQYVNENFALSYDSAYRDCTEDFLYPCVKRVGYTIDQAVLDASPEWQAFVARRTQVLSCAALRDLPRVNAGHLSDVQRYLHGSLSALFAWTGPRRSTYVVALSAMFVLTVLAAYGLMRLAAAPVIAALVTLPFVFSDLHLRNALHPAEYAKAPFFLGCMFVVGLIVKRATRRGATLALAAAAGLVVGVGIGFKTDVLVCIPIALAAIIAFAPAPAGVGRRSAAAVVFAVAVLLSAWPVLKAQFSGEWGSLLPVQVLGGMDRSFADYYADPSLYDYGIRFDDTHITYVINSYDQRVNGSTVFSQFYSKEMQKAATQLVADIDRTFPADFLLRSFAAVVNVLKLARIGVLAAAVVLPLLLVANLRLGAAVLFFLCTAIGYTSLVFQPKHFFHLEWVPWWFTAVALQQVWTTVVGARENLATLRQRVTTRVRAQAGRLVAVAAVAIAIVIVMVAARQYQQGRVAKIVADAMQHATDSPVATVVTLRDDGSRRVSIDDPAGESRPTALRTDYLVLTVECRAFNDATIIAVYQQPTSPRESVTVPCARGARHWELFWPVYQYPPESRLLWFESSAAAPIEIRSINRVRDLRSFRVLLKLIVPDDYAHQPWYHTLRRRFFVDSVGPPRHA